MQGVRSLALEFFSRAQGVWCRELCKMKVDPAMLMKTNILTNCQLKARPTIRG